MIISNITIKNKAKIINEEVDGKKRLAYTIDKQDFGLYYYFDLQLPAEAPAKISSAFNIADEILRYLLVRTDERKAKFAAKRAARAAKAGNQEEVTPEDQSEDNTEEEA